LASVQEAPEPPQGEIHIITLDDNYMIAEYIRGCLKEAQRKWGNLIHFFERPFELHVAHTAAEAREKILNLMGGELAFPPVCILDIDLGVYKDGASKTGIHFAHSLFQQGLLLPSVFFSGIHATNFQRRLLIHLSQQTERDAPIYSLVKNMNIQEDCVLFLALLHVLQIQQKAVQGSLNACQDILGEALPATIPPNDMGIEAEKQAAVFQMQKMASEVSGMLKQYVYGAFSEFRDMFQNEEGLSADHMIDDARHTLNILLENAKDDAAKPLTSEERDMLAGNIDFFTFLEYAYIRMHPPVIITPVSVGDAEICSEDIQEKPTIPGDQKNIGELMHVIGRAHNWFFPKEGGMGFVALANMFFRLDESDSLTKRMYEKASEYHSTIGKYEQIYLSLHHCVAAQKERRTTKIDNALKVRLSYSGDEPQGWNFLSDIPFDELEISPLGLESTLDLFADLNEVSLTIRKEEVRHDSERYKMGSSGKIYDYFTQNDAIGSIGDFQHRTGTVVFSWDIADQISLEKIQGTWNQDPGVLLVKYSDRIELHVPTHLDIYPEL